MQVHSDGVKQRLRRLQDEAKFEDERMMWMDGALDKKKQGKGGSYKKIKKTRM